MMANALEPEMSRLYFDVMGIIGEMKDNKQEWQGDYDNAEFYELINDLVEKSRSMLKLFNVAMQKGEAGPEAE